MNANILKFLAFVQEDGVHEVDETKPIWSEYERLYGIYTEFYRENHEDGDDLCEVVDGEFSNHHTNLYAMSKDGTEYNMTGEVWYDGIKPGDVVGDFLDQDGMVVLVVSKE